MDHFRITHYKLGWNLEIGLGTIELMSSSGNVTESILLEGIAQKDFSVMVDILRNEKPVFWNRTAQELLTGAEMTGEQEG